MRRSQVILLAMATALGLGAARAQDLVDGITAVVNDVPVTRLQIEHLTEPDVRALLQQYGNQPAVLRNNVMRLNRDATEDIINRNVILHDFKESIKVPDSIIDEFVTDRVNELIKDKFRGSAGFVKYLENEGITKEEYRQQIRDAFIVEQMRMKFVPEPIISPRKVEDYYVAHRDDFKLEDQIKMRMIVIKKNPDEPEQTRKRVEEILSQIKGGASFAELAVAYSAGSTQQEGGETGWEDVSIVNKTLVAELDKLKPGQYSGVVDLGDSYYLLLLEDRHPAHFKSLTDVRTQIERILAARETDRLQKVWLERLRKKTFVKYYGS